jgi:hypothetical protein
LYKFLCCRVLPECHTGKIVYTATKPQCSVFEREAVANITADLILLEGHSKELTKNPELNQITTLLYTLEVRLHNFQQLLTKIDHR